MKSKISHNYFLLNTVVVIVLVFFTKQAQSQSDTLNKSEKTSANDDSFIFRPTFGLGVGTFTFIGDVGRNNKGFHPNVSRIGYELRVSNPLTDYFDITFYTVFGTLSSSERSPTRNLNFQSQIRTGGAILSYNFLPIISEKRQWEPYLFLGIESFEFLSKTDLFDNFGNRYHYWTDGSIRNIDQSDPNAGNAIIIQRDYHYETDIRESNLDGFGKYQERSWAIPVGLGFQAILNKHWKFRFGTSLHFTFTDYVDGISDQSIGDRQGNKSNDKFLFTSFTLNYDVQRLGRSKELPVEFDKDGEMWDILARDTVDTDGDRIVDFLDDCAYTPAGVPVDEKGCPLDSDKDLVFDYRDDERQTPSGNVVDEKGVTFTDEDIYQRFLKYMDSTGAAFGVNTIYEEMTSFYAADKPKTNEGTTKFVVVVGTEKRSVHPSELRKFLNTADFKTITSGDTVYYMVGDYKTIEEAIARKNELEKNGWRVDGIGKTENNTTDPTGEKNITIVPNSDLPKNTNTTNTVSKTEVVFRVQIGAFSQKISPDAFKDVPGLIYTKGKDGITRFYSGSFKTMEEAAAHKVDLLLKGYSGSFIVAYKNGERIPIETVGATPVENATTAEINIDEKTDYKTPVVGEGAIKYRIQVGKFKSDVPTEMLDLFLQLDNVKPVRLHGDVIYLTGEFTSRNEAMQKLKEIKAIGLTDAVVVGDFNDKIITAEEAEALLKK